MKKTNSLFNPQNIFILCEFCIIIFTIFLLINRIHYGIDFTDESWYVAEPYIVATEGFVPFADVWNQAPGFTIPLAVVFKLFVNITKGTEGIMLFSRLIFVIWICLIGLLYYVLLKKQQQETPILVCLFSLAGIACAFLFDINYNTIGLLYVFLVLLLLFSDFKNQTSKKLFLHGLLGGVIISRSVLGTPVTLLACLIFVFLLLYKKDWNILFGFLTGIGLSIIIFFSYIILSNHSLSSVFYGLEQTIKEGSYFKIPELVSWKDNIKYFLSFLYPFFVFTILITSTYLIFKEKPTAKLLFLTLVFFFIGIIKKDICRWGWFESIYIYILLKNNNDKRKLIFIPLFVTLIYFSLYIFASITNVYGFGAKIFYFWFPTYMSFLSLFYCIDNHYFKIITFSLGIITISSILLYNSYSNIYRDERIYDLSTVVNKGIWKGCISTQRRAVDVVEVEDQIRQLTHEDDYCLFLDWASFGYLMTKSTACSPTTLDCFHYTYRVNNPKMLYNYFKIKERLPNKIIYIDYGRDNHVSLYEKEWAFNEFVHSFYKQEYVFKNETFKVIGLAITDEAKAKKYIFDR